MPKKKKVRPFSHQWFTEALSHPAFAVHAVEIRAVCVRADKLHRTVSGSKADKIKEDFLLNLRKALSHVNGSEAENRLHRLITQAQSALGRLNDQPALNPKDWTIPIKVAQVTPRKSWLFTGDRGLQGGAPQ